MLSKLSDNKYAGVKTAIITFFTLFAVSLLGFLHNVQEWASGATGTERNFPSLEPLGKGLVSALAAAVVGLVTWGVNYLQEKGKLPGKSATYPAPPPPPAE